MDALLITILVVSFVMIIFVMGFSLYMDFFRDRKPTEKINWKWQDIHIDYDGGYHRVNVLVNRDNGFVVAKVIPRSGGLCEAWYQGKQIGEFIRDNGEAEKSINRRMNLSKLGVK